jgi:hypothetical protein
MKSKISILPFLIIFGLTDSLIAQTKVYPNYTLTIPAGWKESTIKELMDFNQLTNQRYDIMLYPSHKTKYNGPPAILAVFKKKVMSKTEFEKIANELLKSLPGTIKNFIPSEFSSDIKMISPGQGYYDKKRAFFTYMYEGDVKNVGKIYTTVTCCYTPSGLLTFQFSDYSSMYLTTIDGYIRLAKSIKKQ